MVHILSILLLLYISYGASIIHPISSEIHMDTQNQINSLSAQGDDFAEAEKFEQALDSYLQAYSLLPDPAEKWEECTWLLTAIGDVHFQTQNYEAARDNLSVAIRCPNGLGNPFIHLRLGQTFFKLGKNDRALDELMRAYMGGGLEIFEDEDPQYFEFVKKHAKEPPQGW